MRWCSRLSCCPSGAATQTFMSAGRSFSLGRPSRLRYLADNFRKLVEHLADLGLRHDQRRAQRQRVAYSTKHEITLEEAEFKRFPPTLSHRVRPAGEVNANRQANRADVEHIRQPFEAHCCLAPHGFQLTGALKQPFLAIDVQGRQTSRARKR